MQRVQPNLPSRAAGQWSAIAALLTFVITCCRLFVFPFVPILPGGDQLGFLNDGARIVAGELPYRDYFQIVPPGTDLTYALLIRIFGLHTWMPGVVMAILGAAVALVMTRIAARVLNGVEILFPALLFNAFVLYGALDATHHWFSTLAAMLALLILLEGLSSVRIAAAGTLCGVAACFTQTKGAAVVVGFVAYFAWRNARDEKGLADLFRKIVILCLPAAIVFVAVNLYFVRAAGWQAYWFGTIIFPLRYYPIPFINNWRVLGSDFRWYNGLAKWITFPFIYATVPAVYVVFLIFANRRKQQQDDPQQLRLWNDLMLLAFCGIGWFFAIASAPSIKRLSTVGPPAMILLVWLLGQAGKPVRYGKCFLTVLSIVLIVVGCIRTQTKWSGVLDLPGGRTAIPDRHQYEEYRWVQARTHPGQFFYGMPPMNLPLQLRNPAAIDGMHVSDYTRPEQVTALVQALESHSVPLIVLASSKKYPRTTGLPSDHLGPFRDYLCRKYRLTEILPTGDEAWEKRDAANTTCAEQ